MPQKFLRKYGSGTTIDFTLFEADGVDLRVDAAHAAGDTKIMKDEGAEANTSSGFIDEGQGYSIGLSAAELTATRIVIYVVDQTATKVWLDDTLIIETYGHPSAQHAFDFDGSMAVGYYGGYVYYDEDASNTTTVLGVDGTIENPVSSEASAKTLAAQVGYKVKIKGDLAVTTDVSEYQFSAWDGTAEISASASANLSDCLLDEIHLHATALVCNDNTRFNRCSLGGIVVSNVAQGLQGHAFNCILYGTIELPADITDSLYLHECYQIEPSGAGEPHLSWQSGSGQCQVMINDYTGEMHLENMTHADAKCRVNANGCVDIVIQADCTAGIFRMKGIGSLTDSSTGTTVVTTNEWMDILDLKEIQDDTNETLINLATVDTNVDELLVNLATVDSVVDTILSTGNTGPWTTGAAGGGDATAANQEEILLNLGTVDTNVDTLLVNLASVSDVVDDIFEDTDSTLQDQHTALAAGHAALSDEHTGLSSQLITIDTVVDLILATGNTGPWTTGSGGDATEDKQNEILLNLGTVDTNVDGLLVNLATVDSVVDNILSTGNTGPWTTGAPSDATLANQDLILLNLATVDTNVDELLVNLASVDSVVDTILSTGSTGPWTTGAPSDATLANQEAILLNLGTVDTNVDEVLVNLASVDTIVDEIKVKTDNLPDGIKKATAIPNFKFFMVDVTDHISGKTGLTPAGTVKKDAGGWGPLDNTPAADIGNGWYEIDLSGPDLDGDNIAIRFSQTGADDRNISIQTDT